MALIDNVVASTVLPLERLAPILERFDRVLKPLGLAWLVSLPACSSATGPCSNEGDMARDCWSR
jgi:hypothetical protein